MADQFTQTYNDYYNGIASEVGKFADELVSKAKGDYDFTAKYIEKAYTEAVGTGDAERAAFFKQVANDLETKIGTIAFDYQTGSYRTNQDVAKANTRTNVDRTTTLDRLAQEEQAWNNDEARMNAQNRGAQDASLNARGLVNGSRDKMTGLGGMEVGNMEADIQSRADSFARSIGNQRADVNLSADRSIADVTQAGQRSIEDLTTGARRNLNSAQTGRDQGIDAAARARDVAINNAEQQKRASLNQARTYADYYARGKTGAA